MGEEFRGEVGLVTSEPNDSSHGEDPSGEDHQQEPAERTFLGFGHGDLVGLDGGG